MMWGWLRLTQVIPPTKVTGVVYAAQSARRESRIRSRRGVTPSRLLLAGQCQASSRLVEGRRSPHLPPIQRDLPRELARYNCHPSPNLLLGVALARALQHIEPTVQKSDRTQGELFCSVHLIIEINCDMFKRKHPMCFSSAELSP